MLLIAAGGAGLCLASDNEHKEKSIELKPIEETIPLLKPKAPSKIKLSAITDRDGIIVTATDTVVARVQVTDYLNGDIYFDKYVSLSPSYRCALPGIREELTIHITLSDAEYTGYIYLDW